MCDTLLHTMDNWYTYLNLLQKNELNASMPTLYWVDTYNKISICFFSEMWIYYVCSIFKNIFIANSDNHTPEKFFSQILPVPSTSPKVTNTFHKKSLVWKICLTKHSKRKISAPRWMFKFYSVESLFLLNNFCHSLTYK